MSAYAPASAAEQAPYRHEAMFYAGLDGFVDALLPFLRDGVAAGDPTLVVVSAEKIARLRAALGPDAAGVEFADMAHVGANPAHIIPAWSTFIEEHRGRPIRGVGEPIDASRDAITLTECHRHAALLNLAFADTPGFWLVCPYDTTALPEDVLHEAGRTHPVVVDGGERRASEGYAGDEAIAAPFEDPLPPPHTTFHALAFDAATIEEVRRFVTEHATQAGLDPARTSDVVIAVSEIATNSVRHGGGAGVLRTWTDGATFTCEIRDRGVITDPLAGRVEPTTAQVEGRGMWLANRLCDLVQVRAFADGGAVRLHMRR